MPGEMKAWKMASITPAAWNAMENFVLGHGDTKEFLDAVRMDNKRNDVGNTIEASAHDKDALITLVVHYQQDVAVEDIWKDYHVYKAHLEKTLLGPGKKGLVSLWEKRGQSDTMHEIYSRMGIFDEFAITVDMELELSFRGAELTFKVARSKTKEAGADHVQGEGWVSIPLTGSQRSPESPEKGSYEEFLHRSRKILEKDIEGMWDPVGLNSGVVWHGRNGNVLSMLKGNEFSMKMETDAHADVPFRVWTITYRGDNKAKLASQDFRCYRNMALDLAEKLPKINESLLSLCSRSTCGQYTLLAVLSCDTVILEVIHGLNDVVTLKAFAAKTPIQKKNIIPMINIKEWHQCFTRDPEGSTAKHQDHENQTSKQNTEALPSAIAIIPETFTQTLKKFATENEQIYMQEKNHREMVVVMQSTANGQVRNSLGFTWIFQPSGYFHERERMLQFDIFYDGKDADEAAAHDFQPYKLLLQNQILSEKDHHGKVKEIDAQDIYTRRVEEASFIFEGIVRLLKSDKTVRFEICARRKPAEDNAEPTVNDDHTDRDQQIESEKKEEHVNETKKHTGEHEDPRSIESYVSSKISPKQLDSLSSFTKYPEQIQKLLRAFVRGELEDSLYETPYGSSGAVMFHSRIMQAMKKVSLQGLVPDLDTKYNIKIGHAADHGLQYVLLSCTYFFQKPSRSGVEHVRGELLRRDYELYRHFAMLDWWKKGETVRYYESPNQSGTTDEAYLIQYEKHAALIVLSMLNSRVMDYQQDASHEIQLKFYVASYENRDQLHAMRHMAEMFKLHRSYASKSAQSLPWIVLFDEEKDSHALTPIPMINDMDMALYLTSFPEVPDHFWDHVEDLILHGNFHPTTQQDTQLKSKRAEELQNPANFDWHMTCECQDTSASLEVTYTSSKKGSRKKNEKKWVKNALQKDFELYENHIWLYLLDRRRGKFVQMYKADLETGFHVIAEHVNGHVLFLNFDTHKDKHNKTTGLLLDIEVYDRNDPRIENCMTGPWKWRQLELLYRCDTCEPLLKKQESVFKRGVKRMLFQRCECCGKAMVSQ